MKILINFSTLKSGGGQNVAMNFLHAIEKMNIGDVSLYYFIAEDSSIHNYFKQKKYTNFYVVPVHPIKRILFEIFQSKKILIEQKIDIIYSYFGIGFFSKTIPQISGSAASNLYFPEVDFWNHYNGIDKLKKKIINLYRIWGIKRASAVVFENKALEKRSHELYGLGKTITIKPSINFDLESQEYALLADFKPGTPIGLFLCGWQFNKNIMMIPEIALELKKANKEFHFLLTAPLDNSQVHQHFIDLVRKNSVEEMITVTGQVKKEELASLYSQVDYVFLLSKLESFSNNIIESWYFKKPLVIANEIWAKAICKDAAIYVDRDSASEIANTIIEYLNTPEKTTEVLKQSMDLLKEYPSIGDRILEEMEFIKNVYSNP